MNRVPFFTDHVREAVERHKATAGVLRAVFIFLLATPMASLLLVTVNPKAAWLAAGCVFTPIIISVFLSKIIAQWYLQKVAYHAITNFLVAAVLTDPAFAMLLSENGSRITHAYLLRIATDEMFLISEVKNAQDSFTAFHQGAVIDADFEEVEEEETSAA